MASFYERSNNYPLALHFSLRSLKFAQEAKSIKGEVSALLALGSSYYRLADYEQALKYFQQASKKQRGLIASEKLRTKRSSVAIEGWQAIILNRLGATYRRIGQYDQASEMFQQALGYASQVPNNAFMDIIKTQIESLQVDTYGRQGNPKTLAEGHRVLALAKKAGNNRAVNYSVMGLGWYFLGVGQADSAVSYGRQSLDSLEKPDWLALRDANELLAQANAQQKAYEKAYQYQTQFMAYRDSLNNEAVTRKAAVTQYSDQMSRQEDQIALLTKDKQLQTEMARRMALSQQTKAAQQTQLIQKEKMASLGELTAGIAHEIQNSLNFVNNFSDVSTELVDELKEGPFQKLPDSEKEYAAEILGDLTQNLQKITLHGGRASAIVRGMLEHSRSSTGEREPTDLNALVDEYLRLTYQGQRTKDKTFNCELITDFDGHLGKVELVAAEMGRVLLNLINNAFYAVKEKQKTAPLDYQSTVTVSTTQHNGQTEIRVSDNGTGMPESVKAKIFQPFFTTKPTGEGTGLGLSLSYDIVTKGHGGSLTVESQEGEGTAFVIQLPALS